MVEVFAQGRGNVLRDALVDTKAGADTDQCRGQRRVLEHVDLLAAGELRLEVFGMHGQRRETADQLQPCLGQLVEAGPPAWPIVVP
jgi:hypothetical protein